MTEPAAGTDPVATVGIYLWPRMTMLDALGPHQVLGYAEGVQLFTFARTTEPLVTDTGVTIVADYGFDDCPQPDVLLVGGGGNPLTEMSDHEVLTTLSSLGSGARYVTSVCTGALILAEAGLLNGYRATTHWSHLDLLATYPAVQVVPERVVVDRDRITGGGITAGIDFALTLVGELIGTDAARLLELVLEYRPRPPFGTGDPDTAPVALIEQARGLVNSELTAFVSTRAPQRVG